VGEVCDQRVPVVKRVGEADQAMLPGGFCLSNPLGQRLLKPNGVGGRGEA